MLVIGLHCSHEQIPPSRLPTHVRDAVCRSTNVVYRLDTESARTFLAQYVELL
jgi:hypothetical protein